jgi:anti-anti-sigma factor
MEAKFELRGEVMVVELKGRLDFESTAPFRKTCLEKLVQEKVVFDLKSLNFVGSLGLTDFVSTLDDMTQKSQPGVRFCGVSPEFRRLFEASGLSSQQIFETSETAVRSFSLEIL